jgi:hypothetical protein
MKSRQIKERPYEIRVQTTDCVPRAHHGDEHRLKDFECRAVRKMFGPNFEEVAGCRRNLYNIRVGLNNLCSPCQILS